jgi:hypothetical protein
MSLVPGVVVRGLEDAPALRDPAVTLELRREGEPVNPLDFIA